MVHLSHNEHLEIKIIYNMVHVVFSVFYVNRKRTWLTALYDFLKVDKLTDTIQTFFNV